MSKNYKAAPNTAAREAQDKAKADAKASTQTKLAALGLTPAEISALLA